MLIMCGKNKLKAQSATEYALLIAIVLASIVALQLYFHRKVKGRFKYSTDSLGAQFSPRYSRYNLVRFTPAFTMESKLSTEGQSLSVYTGHQITTTINATINPAFETANQFFSPEAPNDLKQVFKDTKIEKDHTVSDATSVLDDFSDTKLVDDKLED